MAEMERERAKKRKPPVGPRGRQKAVRVTAESKVPVAQRLVQFTNQGFKQSAGKLFCEPCREVLQNLKEGLKRHVKTAKHVDRLKAWCQDASASRRLGNDLGDYFAEHMNEQGVSTCRTQHVHN